MKLQITDWYVPTLLSYPLNKEDSFKRGHINWVCPTCDGHKYDENKPCFEGTDNKCNNYLVNGKCNHTKCNECNVSGIAKHNYFIQIFGITDDNKRACVTVPDFRPYFYVKPPHKYRETEKLENKIDEYLTSLYANSGKVVDQIYKMDWDLGKEVLKPFYGISKNIKSEIASHNVEYHFDFKGFQNNKKTPFVKFIAKSGRAYKKYVDAFNTENMKKEGWKLYESNIDGFIRFAHERDIKLAGWIEVNDKKLKNNEYPGLKNNTEIDVVVSKNHVKSCDINSIGRIRIASFDIECNSSHGDFPVEFKDYKKIAEELCDASYDIVQNAKDNDKVVANLIKKVMSTVLMANDMVWGSWVFSAIYLKKPFDPENEKSVAEHKALVDKLMKHKALIIQFIRDGSASDLNKLLTNNLPPIAGDPIIQIGTTYSEYGSPDILRKVIVTIGGCSKSLEAEGIEVINCETEKDMLMEWKRVIQNDTPHILTGYNINGFDFRYIYNRLNELNITTEFLVGFGNNTTRQVPYIEKTSQSSAMGIIKSSFLDLAGILIVDMYSYLCKSETWDSYKLDSVAEIILGEHKIDLKPSEMFKKYRGNDDDRADIARYCIQDCALVNRIIHKKKIIENNFGMANVCHAPARFIFTRGQGIKILSLVAYECRKRDQLIKVIGKDSDEDDKYEGAIVLPPKTGIYIDDPIVVFDYSSLYPSSMIAENISHDSYIEKKDIPKYIDEQRGCLLPNIVKDDDLELNIVDCGCNICHHFVKSKSGKRSTLPDILDMLIKQRKIKRSMGDYKKITTKDGIEYIGLKSVKKSTTTIKDLETGEVWSFEKDDIVAEEDRFNNFEKAVFDALQLAYKITANSLYGQTGSLISPIAMMSIAESTTATGRNMIVRAKQFVEKKYEHLNADVIYGDSVMPYTPITTLNGDGMLSIQTFKSIQGEWTPYDQFIKDGDQKQQIFKPGFKVWTDKGWAEVVRVIRHKTVKRIYRVLTHTGLVDVTEDHSLLDTNRNIIKPSQCQCHRSGNNLNNTTELLHSKMVFPTYKSDSDISIDEAYVFGMFVGDGSCGSYRTKHGMKYTWVINNKDYELLTKCKDLLYNVYGLKFHILDTLKSSNVYKLVPCKNKWGDVKRLVEHYRNKCYLNDCKIVPNVVLNSNNLDILESFRNGLFDSDGCRKDYYTIGSNQFDTKTQVSANSYMVLLQKLGYNVSINDRKDKPHIYRLTYTYKSFRKCEKAIKKLFVLHDNYDGFVYDIETEQGVFNAGIGNIILKNTDSIFCKFDLYDSNNKRVYGKDAIPYAIKLGQHIEKDIYDNLLVNYKPQKLNYEKVLSPFILFSKKRYTGLLYEFDPNDYIQKSMGIVLKRRDNAPIVKKVYGEIIDKILINNDLQASFTALNNWLERIVSGDIHIDSLVITKKLNAKYANPTAIPHRVLADRMLDRDPGNAPAVNDRVPFVYIIPEDVPVDNTSSLKNSEMVEHPEYIKEHNLRPNFLHYITNQIMNPILQLYALCIEDIPNYDLDPAFWERERCRVIETKSARDMNINEETITKRLNELKENKVRDLLFTPYISQLGGKVSRNDIGGVLQNIMNTTNSVGPYHLLANNETNTDQTLNEEKKEMKIKVTKSTKNENISVELNKKKYGNPHPLSASKINIVIDAIKKTLQTDEYSTGLVNIEVKGCAEIIKHWISLTDTFRIDRNSNMWFACVSQGSISSLVFKELSDDIHRIKIY